MGDTMSQRFRFDNLVTPQDVATAGTVNTNAGMYRSMAQYATGTVVITAELTNLKTAVCQLTQSSAATATGKADVSGKTATLTGSATTSQVGSIDFSDVDLTSAAATKYFVGVDITTNQNGDDVQAVLIRGGARYAEESMDA